MTFCLKNLKGYIKRAHSDNAVHMRHKTEHLHGISEENLQDYFEIWKNRREKNVAVHRDCFIGTSFEPCNFSIIRVLLTLSHLFRGVGGGRRGRPHKCNFSAYAQRNVQLIFQGLHTRLLVSCSSVAVVQPASDVYTTTTAGHLHSLHYCTGALHCSKT